MMTITIIIRFFIYLRAELNSQGPITELALMQNNNRNKHKDIKQTNNKKKQNPLLLFQFKHKFLTVSVDIQTALAAAEAHPAEGRWLKEQLNVVKLPMFTNADSFWNSAPV
jgi:ABC-type transporter MlaC component